MELAQVLQFYYDGSESITSTDNLRHIHPDKGSRDEPIPAKHPPLIRDGRSVKPIMECALAKRHCLAACARIETPAI